MAGAQSSGDACGPQGCGASHDAQATAGAPVVIRSTPQTASDQRAAAGTTAAAAEKATGGAETPDRQTDFEKFVNDTLGHSLPVFGRNLFAGAPGNFVPPPTGISPPSDYVIGPGDELIIRSWGKVDIDVRPTVDRNGQIFLPRVGTLTVAGLKMSQLEGFIRDAIGQEFKGFELTVTLGQLRSIQIFVLGQAKRPGVYTISSLSTLVNALFESGGPSYAGTMRDIQLKRGGQTIAHFDVYRLLLEGDKTQDVHLLAGDIIYIPLIGPQVAVDGDVTTPGIYELKGPSAVEDVLKDAGGITAIATTKRLLLERVTDHSHRVDAELALDEAGRRTPLMGGDILQVFPISPQIENAVTLRGPVAMPGRYGWHEGMRVSDLIPSRAFLISRSYFNRQNALGQQTSDQVLSTAEAATSTPPAVEQHDSELNWNYAVIERLDPKDLTTRLVPFVLGEAVDNPNSAENKPLLPGDVVIIYARKDMSLPVELEARFVRIDGQVNAPGVYRMVEGETMRDLLRRAGGPAPHAYLYASALTRASVREDQEKQLKSLLEEESREALSPANVNIQLSTSGTGGTQQELDLRKAYLQQLAQIHPDGRVVLHIRPDAKTVDDVPAFGLEDGDHIFVPSLLNTVEVLGSVYNQGALEYTPGARFKSYLDAAGGPSREADAHREFVIRADGTIISRQRMRNMPQLVLYPGDTVVVPPRFRAHFSLDLTAIAALANAVAITAIAAKAAQ
jgi:protein involved in polysaccharide export with SLBB domain